MPQDYVNDSIEIADKFIKTICFVDDQPIFNNVEDPVNEDIDHRLNANVITKAFAPSGKSCSFYQYQKPEEEDDIINLANSSDVNVLDWRIILQDENPLDGHAIAAEEDNEVDVAEKESRGRYALQLIEKILQRNEYSSPKLILILTAESDIDAIYDPIKEKLTQLGISFESNDTDLSFQNKNFRISIYFKESPQNRHLSEEVRQKTVALVDLPSIVNREFAKLTDGLVLGTALQCISMVRAKTFLLLGSYNKELDPAYLTHKALLPDPKDAEDLLIDIIGSDIKSILKSSEITTKLRDNILPNYIDHTYNQDNYPFVFDDADKIPEIGINPEISKPVLKSVIQNGIEQTFLKNTHPIDQVIYFKKYCHKNLISTFEANAEKATASNIQFAVLTTIKPQYQVSQYYLTQGTVLKEEGNRGNYWLCMQPKCDSVRISTNKRAFLLLKLNIGDISDFQIVINHADPIYLKVKYEVYNSKLVEFKSDGQGNVSSFVEAGIIKFRKGDNLNMVWLAELKSDVAQSISNIFSSQLSRVGYNPSEWLRRSS
ncbi:response regulator receiver domain [Dyadobacter sandarakinus]|uniref:Response receiver domain-containing protein n=1 Tax=Dyadobacter sandarakinus TaxID=2747268 RepID=A0ABX7I944_9BACT|nr:response regulator receiver domain [Dyadobacter sandarakinus]QRR02621.1 hypothetical protein HWI92_17730 [Dyadobacter sandarakinus]